MAFTLGLVQPQGYRGADEEKNVDRAVEYIDEASDRGVELLCFPEGYPGPFSGPRRFDPAEEIRSKAASAGIYTVYGGFEETPDGVYTTQFLIGPDGQEVGKYRRTMPAAPAFYEKILEIDHHDLAWGNRVPVFETELCTVGIVVCSELFSPELSRVLALKGADVILNPSGWITWTLRESWRSLARARAIENLAYVATVNGSGAFDGGDALCGRTTVYDPWGTTLSSAGEEPTTVTAEVDPDRVAAVREEFPALRDRR